MAAYKIILSFAILVIISFEIGPNQASAAKSDQEIVATPQLSLELVDSKERVIIWNNLPLLFSVTNGDGHYYIENISISIPQEMALAILEDGTVPVIQEGLDLQNPHQRLSFLKEIKRKSLKEALKQPFVFLLYRSHREVLVARMTYKDGDKPESPSYPVTSTLSLEVEGHPFGMYAGALAGTLLIILLRFTRAARQSPTPGWSDLIQQFFSGLAQGAVATAIALFLFQTTSDFKFPITITVKDFYGGVLLGLFGEIIASAIYNWIFSTPEH
jgi:hypothetical protein